MRVLIYGAGAVGLGMASCLASAGVETHVVARPETVAALRARGLRRTGIFGEVPIAPGRIAAWPAIEQTPDAGFDYVLVCTKTYDRAEAARSIGAWAGEGAVGAAIVLFQNGWGNAEVFREHVAQPVYNARVITGFRRPEPAVVEVTVHADDIRVGSLFGDALETVAPLCSAIASGGIPCRSTAEIGRDLWSKMLYNCALNPLGAILEATYGELAADAGTRKIMDAVVEEAFAVMAAEGHRTHWPDAEGYLRSFYADMVPPTATHEPSMLQDLRAGRRTEIDALNGAVVALGARQGIEVPVNAALCALVRFR